MDVAERTVSYSLGPVTQTALFAGEIGPGLVCVTSTGVSSATVELNGLRVAAPSDLSAHPTSFQVAVVLQDANALGARLAGRPGESLTVKVYAAAAPGAAPCPPRGNETPQAMQKAWERLVDQAERTVRSIPTLTEVEAAAETSRLYDAIRSFMERFGLEAKQVQALLFAQAAPDGATFGEVVMELVRRREALGRAFEARDVELMEKLVTMARAVDASVAQQVDPDWTFKYSPRGDVIEERAVVQPIRVGPITLPGNLQVFCHEYDPLRRLVGIRYLSRQIGAVQPPGPPPPEPCEDPSRVAVAEFAYDAQNRRVRAKVLGVETFYVYGLSGELLAELAANTTRTAVVPIREYAYLDGQPLAQILPANIGLQRPPPATGATTVPGLVAPWVIALLLFSLAVRYRRARPLAALAIAFWLSTCSGGDPPGSGDAGTAGARQAQGKDPVYWYHLDRLGTPVRMSDARGRTVWRAEYRPFGDVHRLEMDPDGDGTAVENNLRFPGQFDDGVASFLIEQGPYYNWHRYYSPTIGRYPSFDPFLMEPANATGGVFPSMHAYAYANSMPTVLIDPTGLRCEIATRDILAGGERTIYWTQRREYCQFLDEASRKFYLCYCVFTTRMIMQSVYTEMYYVDPQGCHKCPTTVTRFGPLPNMIEREYYARFNCVETTSPVVLR